MYYNHTPTNIQYKDLGPIKITNIPNDLTIQKNCIINTKKKNITYFEYFHIKNNEISLHLSYRILHIKIESVYNKLNNKNEEILFILFERKMIPSKKNPQINYQLLLKIIAKQTQWRTMKTTRILEITNTSINTIISYLQQWSNNQKWIDKYSTNIIKMNKQNTQEEQEDESSYEIEEPNTPIEQYEEPSCIINTPIEQAPSCINTPIEQCEEPSCIINTPIANDNESSYIINTPIEQEYKDY